MRQGKPPLRGFREQESYSQVDRKINLINNEWDFFAKSSLVGQNTNVLRIQNANVITQVICYLLNV